MKKVKESAKAVASLVSGVCVAVIAVGVDSDTGKALAIVAAVAGAVVVWAVPNKKPV